MIIETGPDLFWDVFTELTATAVAVAGGGITKETAPQGSGVSFHPVGVDGAAPTQRGERSDRQGFQESLR